MSILRKCLFIITFLFSVTYAEEMPIIKTTAEADACFLTAVKRLVQAQHALCSGKITNTWARDTLNLLQQNKKYFVFRCHARNFFKKNRCHVDFLKKEMEGAIILLQSANVVWEVEAQKTEELLPEAYMLNEDLEQIVEQLTA